MANPLVPYANTNPVGQPVEEDWYKTFRPTTENTKGYAGSIMPPGTAAPTQQRNVYSNPLSNFLNAPWGGTPVNAPQSQPYTGGQSLVGAPAFGYTPAYGGVPQVPNPIGTQAGAIGGNLGNLGQLGQLGTGLTGINAGIGQQPYQANLPNYQALLGQASGNALSNLRGTLPADVVRNLQQAGAERGTSIGSPGSPNANAAYLRALGLTSLGLQQTGQQQFGQLVGLTPTGPQFNPASMLLDPAALQQAQAAANLYNSAPIPSAAHQAAFNAMQAGLGRGQGATQPYGYTQPGSIQDIMQKYSPFQGGTPSYGNLPEGYKANPNAVANTYSSQADEADLLNELFGEGSYANQGSAQPDYGSYTGDPFQDFFTGIPGEATPPPLPPEDDWYNYI